MQKRVLIVTYYWPPSGGSGVQRWLKMSKYMPENNWLPIVYTPSNAEYPVEDTSLEADVNSSIVVLKQPIIEPYNLYKRFLHIKKEKKVKAAFIRNEKNKSWKENLSIWIRGNIFIPDSRVFWVRPSVKYLLRYIKQNPIDAIITTGPPHSVHLIGEKLHRITNIPWLADFRDPWTDVFYFDDLKLTRLARHRHKKMENMVISNASRVVTVSRACASDLELLGAKNVSVVTNGYDEFDVASVPLSSKFTISHIGILTPRSNVVFWEAIGELAHENMELKNALELRLIGEVDRSIISILEEHELLDNTTILPYMPHNKVIIEQRAAQVLLLIILRASKPEGIITGKIYEYLQAKRPILMVGATNGDAARIIEETRSGIAVDYDDKTGLKLALLKLFEKYKKGELNELNSRNIEKYSRRNLAGEICSILDEITIKL